jgi:hypothetical protein
VCRPETATVTTTDNKYRVQIFSEVLQSLLQQLPHNYEVKTIEQTMQVTLTP